MKTGIYQSTKEVKRGEIMQEQHNRIIEQGNEWWKIKNGEPNRQEDTYEKRKIALEIDWGIQWKTKNMEQGKKMGKGQRRVY